jgi:hypothetical protein
MSILHDSSRSITYCPIPYFGRESDATSKIEFALPEFYIVSMKEEKSGYNILISEMKG